MLLIRNEDDFAGDIFGYVPPRGVDEINILFCGPAGAGKVYFPF